MTNFAINEIPQKTSLIRGDCFEVFKNSEFCTLWELAQLDLLQ